MSPAGARSAGVTAHHAHPAHSRLRSITTQATVVLLLLAGLGGCSEVAPAVPKTATPDTAPASSGGSRFPTPSGALAPFDVPPPPVLQDIVTPVPAAGDVPSINGDSLAAVDAQLDKTLADAARCSTDNECRSVAVGGKACGGPTGYRAYSSKLADVAAVERLADQERHLSLAAARASGRVSPCYMVADPGARCEARQCVTGAAAPTTTRINDR